MMIADSWPVETVICPDLLIQSMSIVHEQACRDDVGIPYHVKQRSVQKSPFFIWFQKHHETYDLSRLQP